jgi:hypothetical protein
MNWERAQLLTPRQSKISGQKLLLQIDPQEFDSGESVGEVLA